MLERHRVTEIGWASAICVLSKLLGRVSRSGHWILADALADVFSEVRTGFLITLVVMGTEF